MPLLVPLLATPLLGVVEAHYELIRWEALPASAELADCKRELVSLPPAAPRLSLVALPAQAPEQARPLVDRCRKVADKLGKKDKKNAELTLLRAQLATDRWLLGDGGDVNDIAELYLRAAAGLAEDPRPTWLQAQLFANAGLLTAAEGLISSVESREWPQPLPAAFWWDYANLEAIAQRRAHALQGLDRGVALGGDPAPFEALRAKIVASYRDPGDTQSFSREESWTEDPAHGKLCNHRFDFCVTVPEGWGGQFLEETPDKVGLMLAPPVYTEGRNQIQVNVIFIAMLDDGTKLEDRLAQTSMPGSTARPYSLPIEGAVAAEMTNPELYPAVGGLHGVVAFWRRSRPPYPGLSWERAVGTGFDSNAPVLVPVPAYDRVQGDVVYMLTMDGADLVWPRAEQDLSRLVGGLVIE